MMNLIVASTLDGVIGAEGKLPWHYPEDLKYFKEVTEGHIVVMGRKTYESIGKPLSNRVNIVLSTKRIDDHNTFCGYVTNITNPFGVLPISNLADKDTFIIGGASIYKLFLPVVDRIYLTLVRENYEGDTRIPVKEILDDVGTVWNITRNRRSKNAPLEYLVLDRMHGPHP